jgi:hypothetical protein
MPTMLTTVRHIKISRTDLRSGRRTVARCPGRAAVLTLDPVEDPPFLGDIR